MYILNDISIPNKLCKPLLLVICGLSLAMATSAQDLLIAQGSGKIFVQTNATAVVEGSVLLQNGSTLSNEGTITMKEVGAAGITNWADGSITPYHYGNGTVLFNGIGGHNLTTRNTFGRINLNTTAQLTLGRDVNIDKLYLINGKLTTTVFYKAIVHGTTNLAVEAAPTNPVFANSWINGKLRRYITPATVNQYIFPIGDASKTNLALLNNLSANPINNATYIDALFGVKPGSDLNLVASEGSYYYTEVSTGGVWYLTPDVEPSSGEYDVQLYFTGFSDLNNNEFAILKRPTLSMDASEWEAPAGSTLNGLNMAGRTLAGRYATRKGITSFSQFGIGNFTTAVLAYTQIEIQAERSNNHIVTNNWKLKTELNCSGYYVERRLANESYFSTRSNLIRCGSGINSNDYTKYTFTDSNQYIGLSYYRIKQIQHDGATKYSNIDVVKGSTVTGISITAYPNPNNGSFMVKMNGLSGTYKGVLTDMGGKIVKTFNLHQQSPMVITGLSAATYLLKITDLFGLGNLHVEKIMVVK
jgi:hypothetical protein